MNLQSYGWAEPFLTAFETFCSEQQAKSSDLHPGRLILDNRKHIRLWTEFGPLDASLAGRLLHRAKGSGRPVVGDWVVWRRTADTAVIEAVLPRRSQIARSAAGRRTEEQILAANVDVAFLVMGLDGDYSPRRLERYLSLVWESGARPVIVLTKVDLHPDFAQRVAELETIALGVPIHPISCPENLGLEDLRTAFAAGETVVLLGSSGAGKSTLANTLFGREILRTNAVRKRDERGQHTTTHRQLVLLPEGGLLIDSPGLRELQLWSSTEGLERGFSDIQALAQGCRYRDCRHQGEPGCAVQEAVEQGLLSGERLRNLHDLEKEQRYLARRKDARARREAERETIALHRAVRRMKPKP